MKHLAALCAAPLAALLVPAAATAQTTFAVGPRAGLSLSTAHFAGNSAGTPSAHRPGFEAGLAANVGRGHWAFQPAVLFSQLGYRTHGVPPSYGPGFGPQRYDEDVRLNYLTAPLLLSYAVRADGRGLQAFAGPYAALLLGGRYQTYYRAPATPIGGGDGEYDGRIVANGRPTDFDHRYARPLDYGLHAGLGYRCGALLLQATYRLGLRSPGASTTVRGYTYDGTTYYNRAVQVSLAYLFGPKSA